MGVGDLDEVDVVQRGAGTPGGLMRSMTGGVTRDVTQEVEAHLAAQAAERRLEAILEGLPAELDIAGTTDFDVAAMTRLYEAARAR